jgi:type II secretory pathway component PulJ
MRSYALCLGSKRDSKKKSGFALIQILIITSIFSVLLLLMVAFSNQAIKDALRIQQVHAERLNLYSAANDLLFLLLTKDWYQAASLSYVNFYGYPFQLNIPDTSADKAIFARIQSVSGLLDLRAADTELQKWLEFNHVNSATARQLINQLNDAQRPDRGRQQQTVNALYFQHLSELNTLDAWSPELIKQLKGVSRLHGDEFNLYLAPDELMAALLPAAQFDIIRRWRQEGSYNINSFRSLVGHELAEQVSLFSSLELNISISAAQSTQQLHLQVKIQPNDEEPVKIYSRWWGAK